MTQLAHRIAHPSTRRLDLREETSMFHIELRLESIEDRQARLRSARAAERFGGDAGRSLRQRIGQSVIRLGRRIGGDAMTAPAWQA